MAEASSNSIPTTSPPTPGSADDKIEKTAPTGKTTDDTRETPNTSPPATATATVAVVPDVTDSGAYSSGDWQAIWSPAHNAYYFYNSVTRETTWVNPLQSGQGQQQVGGSKGKGKEKAIGETDGDEDTTEGQDEEDKNQGKVAGPSTNATGETTPALTQWEQMQANAIAQGIDPSLAHLDPSLAAGPAHPSGAFTARFNARTGAFTATDGRDPSHLSEYERAKRMSQFYFDVGGWEEELEQRDTAEEERKKKRKPTKKDLVSPFSQLTAPKR